MTRPMTPPPVYDSHSTRLRPYLQLPALLSLTWLAYPILSLIFIAFRLQISLASAETSIASAKENLVASCKAAEKAATSAASMPTFLAAASNKQFAEAVNGTLNAARATLVLALTMMEAIINFIVDIYRSTFLCFLELVVRGGLAILIGAVQELNTFVQNLTSGLRTSIQNDVASANSVIQSAVAAFNKVNPFDDVKIAEFSIPSLSALDNVSLPTDFEDALVKLNGSIPSVASLKDKIESVIDTPFELLKKDINDTFSTVSFDANVLPIPQRNTLTFCNDLDLSVVDDLGHDLVKIAKIGTIILVLLALLLVGLNCALEWYKWRCLKQHMQYTREAWSSDPTIKQESSKSAMPTVTLSNHNLMMLAANSSHPLLTRIANKMSALFRFGPTTHTHVQWFLHYVFHAPALACFLIGFFGLLSVQIQLIAIGPLADKYSARVAASASDYSTTIATSINDSMFNQSSVYATDVNGRVDLIQTTINDGLFGWVNVTTTTLNTTIVEFYNEIQGAVGTVFNGTILEAPANDFIRCIIGTKIEAIENALTFLHDNLVVNMPRVNQTVLMLSPDQVNEMTTPIAAAAIGENGQDDGGIIGRIVLAYAASLKKERLMFAIFMGLWGLVVLMAVAAIFWNIWGRRGVESYKRRRWQKEQRSGINGLVVPFRSYNPDQEDQRNESLPDLTPLPSPGYTHQFNRSVSPDGPYNQGLSDAKADKRWDSLFSSKKPVITTRNIGKPMEIKSGEDVGNPPASHWLSRMTGIWKKDSSSPPDSESGHHLTDNTSPRQRPNLRISIESALAPDAEVPRSTWSASPTRRSTLLPWSNLLMPTKPKARPNVPSDVSNNSSNVTLAPIPQSSPFAPPIHHGFEHRVRSATPPPALSPRWVAPLPTSRNPSNLGPPSTNTHHRRTSSVPASATTPNNNADDIIISNSFLSTSPSPAPSLASTASMTPVTRMLTTQHARKSSSVNVLNPFATPFDDEHRVMISPPAHVRKSTQINPFAAQAF